MHFTKGDKVRLLDEPAEGIITHVGAKDITVDIDGLEFTYTLEQLVKVEHDDLITHQKQETALSSKDKSVRAEGKQKLKGLNDVTEAIYELDLHIDELLDHYGHMSNGEILQHQMNACRSFVREAIDKRFPKIVLIHGVGEGVLKHEIHRYLDQLQHIEYHDAPYRTYGYGATEIIIHR